MFAFARNPLNRFIFSLILGSAVPVCVAADLEAAKDFEYTQLSLDPAVWEIENNGKDSDGDPEYLAHFDGTIELDLGELATIPFITGDPDDMLDAYEDNLKGVFHVLDRQKSLPKGFKAPRGFVCRAYRGALFESSPPDSTDLTCYAPYRGGTRTLQIAIKDGAKASHLQALQRAVDAIRLSAE